MKSQEHEICQYPFYEKYLAELLEKNQSLSDSDKTEVIFCHIIMPVWLIHVISDVNFICVEYSELLSLICGINEFICMYENELIVDLDNYNIYSCAVIPKQIKKIPPEVMERINKLEVLINQHKLSKEQTENNEAIEGMINVIPLRL